MRSLLLQGVSDNFELGSEEGNNNFTPRHLGLPAGNFPLGRGGGEEDEE